MARVRNEADTASVTTHGGLQLHQYATQLRKAGLLARLYAAKGMERRELETAANALVRDLRLGRVMPDTKEHAARLGLRIYPN